MSNVWFTSDLHLYHRNILKFCPHREEWYKGLPLDGETTAYALVNRILESTKPKDIIWMLGDISFWNSDSLKVLHILADRRLLLVRGNHDELRTTQYLEYFEEVYGLHKKYRYWLSHAPTHPLELRGKRNLHGHTHARDPHHMGPYYYDVGVDANNGYPVSLNHIRDSFKRLEQL